MCRFDDIEFGPTSSRNPVQCAFVKSAITPSREAFGVIDSAIDSLCSDIVLVEGGDLGINEEDIASKVLFNILCSDVTSPSGGGMFDSLQFLADVELLNKLPTSPQSQPQPMASPLVPHKTSLPPAAAARHTPPDEPGGSRPGYAAGLGGSGSLEHRQPPHPSGGTWV